MSAPDILKEVIAEGRQLRPVSEGIYSVLDGEGGRHSYDRRAAVYDFVVGTRLYNRLMWGASPLDYAAFARRALAAGEEGGRFLDAGCGSMLFTAGAYLESRRQVVAFDQSLGMLKRARSRLVELSGSVPANVLLLQADLDDLPFRARSFDTVLSMNVLHLYRGQAAALVSNLGGLVGDGGRLYLTSLVSSGRLVGDNYLRLLHRAGEFVRPRSGAELRDIMKASLGGDAQCETGGNMAYASAAARRESV